MPLTGAVGVVGGTGPEGRGLALRLALAGCDVMIGSRDRSRADAAVAGLVEKAPATASSLSGRTNAEAADEAEIVILSVPYEGQAAVLDEIGPLLSGKIALSVVAPIEVRDGVALAAAPPEGSAAEAARDKAPAARWAAGLHTLPARDLLRADAPVETDALICGDDGGAKGEVMRLAGLIDGVRAVDAGPLVCARYLEAATALLININRIYRAHASLKIAGL